MTKHAVALAVASLLTVAAAPALANTGACAAPSAEAARATFDRWATALPGHNEDLMLAFYTPDHSFKPHDADAALTDRTEIREWWQSFVDRTPAVELSQSTITGDCKAFTKTGVKTITAGSDSVTASFTMDYANVDGVWLIQRHELTPVTN